MSYRHKGKSIFNAKLFVNSMIQQEGIDPLYSGPSMFHECSKEIFDDSFQEAIFNIQPCLSQSINWLDWHWSVLMFNGNHPYLKPWPHSIWLSKIQPSLHNRFFFWHWKNNPDCSTFWGLKKLRGKFSGDTWTNL